MESNAFKAITIGVGVLIAIATISIVLTYYNSAKEGVAALGKGSDLSANYDKYILDILTKPEAVGTDVLNLLNYFEKDRSVEIYLIYGGDERTLLQGVKTSYINANDKFRIEVLDSGYTKINVICVEDYTGSLVDTHKLIDYVNLGR